MGLLNWLRGSNGALQAPPRAAVQESGVGVLINTPEELEAAIRSVMVSGSGAVVNSQTALRVAAVFACVRLKAGAVANMPLHIKRRVSDKVREDASDHSLWSVFHRQPNGWQTPSQFKRMMEAHLMLRGDAYALIVRSRGSVVELIPLHPDRVECEQSEDLSLSYTYQRKDGRKIKLAQSDVFHLVGLTLDGVHGVSVLTYARETIGLALSMEDHGANTFANGARPSNVLVHPAKLGKEAQETLRASLDAYRSGGDREGKSLILEEGMKIEKLSMTAEDAQWIESRKFSRGDIAMFFGVPPHMIGDTEKSTSWGSGIEQQSIGFVTYTLEDSLTTWEESIGRDLIPANESDIYARFNRKSLVRGDIKTRKEFYTSMMQWGVYSPNEIRAYEDENPRDGGDVYYQPPNAAGGDKSNPPDPMKEEGPQDEPAPATEN